MFCVGSSRYFDGNSNTRAENAERPTWARGVELTEAARANAGQRVGRDVKWVKSMAAEHTAEAIAALVEALEDGDGRVKVAAAVALLDRAWGRPAQQVAVEHDHKVTFNPEELRARIARVVEAKVIEPERQQPALPPRASDA